MFNEVEFHDVVASDSEVDDEGVGVELGEFSASDLAALFFLIAMLIVI